MNDTDRELFNARAAEALRLRAVNAGLLALPPARGTPEGTWHGRRRA